MRPQQNTLKLPAKLVNELGDVLSRGRRSHFHPGSRNPASRKEARKAERLQKKAQRNEPPPPKRLKTQHAENPAAEDDEPWVKRLQPRIKSLRHEPESPSKKPKSILKHTKKADPVFHSNSRPRSISPLTNVSRAVKDKLAEDDEEIAALEKMLGLKGKKSLPQPFKDDGLAELLCGLDEDEDSETREKRKRKAEGDDWLDRKREEARRLAKDKNDLGTEDYRNGILGGLLHEGDEANDDDDDGASDMSAETFSDLEENFDANDDFNSFGSDNPAQILTPRRIRENPYIAPTTTGEAGPTKYIPPSLRKIASSDSDALVRLRRQMQGLVNRLTETNLISILADIEKLYRDNARQHVTSTLIDLLLMQICDPTALPDTSIIVPAGFIASVYKIIGTDFGAQIIQRTVELFDDHYSHATATGNQSPEAAVSNSSKETSNLITLLSELYNFQVIGSNLMFDYIRLFLGRLSELNAELLLRMIRVSGAQLRQEDPLTLKEIVGMLRPAVSSVGQENISVRTKFMVETINDLKNNRMKTGAVASAITLEHTIKMKKTLGTLNTRNIKASEPLRIGLMDIQQSDKKGKWWLVGASWSGKAAEENDGQSHVESGSQSPPRSAIPIDDAGTTNLIQLASEQRMNTDIRRAIFVTIMSASDYQDAHLRLMKLKLKRVQELEIPKVLIRCSGAEKSYNPYYTLIAKKLCGDRRLKMAFQFSLWDLFKKMGETDEVGDALEDKDEEDALDSRHIVNLSKMFGTLIVDGGLGLNVLKNLNLSYLQSKTKTFLEVMFITIFLHSQRHTENQRDEQEIATVFKKVKDTPQLISGLQYFMKKVVSKTDIAGGNTEKAIIKWACKIATLNLEAVAALDDAKD